MSQVGRPPKYKDPEELQKKIDAYFKTKDDISIITDEDGKAITDKHGKIMFNVKPPSVAGLALYLGYESRQSIYDNGNKEEFSYIIKKARSRCEIWVHDAVCDGIIPPAVGIFLLKQFGYSDKMELEHTGKNGGPIQFEATAEKLNELFTCEKDT